MIPSYRDHAANERTFLAWIRTSLTIMALGFVIERLDIFLAGLAPGAATGSSPARPEIHSLSVAMVALGILLIVASTFRFITTNRAIDTQAEQPFKSVALPIGMAMLMFATGVAVLLHLLRLF